MESIFKLGILLSVIDRVSGPSQRIGQSMTGLRGRVLSLGPAFDKFKSYGLILTTVAAGILNMMSGTVMATTASQKALGELSSVGITDLDALARAGQDFSGTWSGTTKAEFISAAYDIKSGISTLTDEGVAEFTKLAALTGKATKSATAEMTSLFATGYGIYKDMYADLSDMQFGEVFSAGIAASVKNFKTTGSGMAQAISQLGATATTANVPFEEQLTILGMLQATMTGSEAGTKYKAMMQAAAGAGEKLGLQFLDSNNQLLSMPEILLTLRNQYGDTLDAMEKMDIQKAFGTQEAVAVIDLLYGKVGDLQSNIRHLSGAMARGATFAQQMAMAMNVDPGAGMALLAQRWHNLVEIIGQQFLPVLIPLFTWIGEIIRYMTEFAQTHEMLTRAAVLTIGTVAAVVFILGGLAAALGAVGLLAPNVMAGFTAVSSGALAVKSGLMAAVASTKTWILWQRQAFLTMLYMEGGTLAYAKTLATAPFRALKRLAVATWGHITALYAQMTAAAASAGGVRALALSMGSGLITSIVGATRAVWGFTTALLANPITWVVLAIAGLVAFLIVLEKEFGILSLGLDLFMFGLGYVAGAAVKAGRILLDAFLAPFRFLGDVIDQVGGVGKAVKKLAKIFLSLVFPPLAIGFYWDDIKTGVPRLLSWIRGLVPGFLAAGRDVWAGFVAGVESMVMMPVRLISAGMAAVRDLLSGMTLPDPFAALGAGADWVMGKLRELGRVVWSVIKSVLSIAFPPLAIAFNWDKVRSGAAELMAWVRGLVPGFLASGRELWSGFTAGVESVVMAPVRMVAAVRDLLAGITLPNPFTALGAGVDRGLGKLRELMPAVQSVIKSVLSITFPPLAIVFSWDEVKSGASDLLAWIRGLAPEFMASGKALWGAFSDGIKAMAMNPVETVKSGLAKLRNLLPFSDAKEGPLSTLSLSGARLMETIGAGIQAQGPVLVKTMAGFMAGLATVIGTGLENPVPVDPARPVPAVFQAAPQVQAQPAVVREVAARVQVPPVVMPEAPVYQVQPLPAVVPEATAMPAATINQVNQYKKQVIQTPGAKAIPVNQTRISRKKVVETANTYTREVRKTENHFHISGLTLSGVSDADSFIHRLLDLAEGNDV